MEDKSSAVKAPLNMFKAAVYVRLSKEDGDKEESNSISNQKHLIREFLHSQPDILLVAEMIDDGYSGANFSRPGFIEMMEAVKQGKINCIIVKDLSRFGRNYIEAGRYIEQIFPFLGLRFIAINDGYDSLKSKSYSDSIIIPFKNLINDAYCRDISTKIKSQFEVKRKKGEFIGSFAPYGYKKSQENKNKLVIDDLAAAVVKEVFKCKLSGVSPGGIAAKLSSQGVQPPAQYKKAMGFSYSSGFMTNEDSQWTAVTVGRILTNPVYIGTMEQGKRISPNFRIKKRVELPKEEWTRVENTHEGIVTSWEFDAVQKLMLKDTRTAPGKQEEYLLSGLLLCGDCHGSMVRKTVPSGSKKYNYYVCSQNKQDKSCSSHSISAPTLEGAVLSIVQSHIASMVTATELVKNLESTTSESESYKRQALEIQLQAKQRELINSQNLLLSVYEDFKDGIVTADDYIELKTAYADRCKHRKSEIAKLKAQLLNLPVEVLEENITVKELKTKGNISSLSRQMAVGLIDKILILEGGRIELCLNYKLG